MSGNPDNPFAAPRPFRPYPPPVAARRPLNRLAVASFVTGLLGLAPVALPLAFVALRRRPPGPVRRRGRGLAWAGIGLSLLWIAVLAVAVGWAVTQVGPRRDDAGAVVAAGRVRPDDVRTGDCVRTLGTRSTGAKVGSLVLVPCGEPNGGQVFAAFDLPDSGWPGEPAAQDGAERGCTARYAVAGRQDAASDIWFLYPTGPAQWRLGDHRVVCLVVPQSRP
jgi:hypothetical protein